MKLYELLRVLSYDQKIELRLSNNRLINSPIKSISFQNSHVYEDYKSYDIVNICMCEKVQGVQWDYTTITYLEIVINLKDEYKYCKNDEKVLHEAHTRFMKGV